MIQTRSAPTTGTGSAASMSVTLDPNTKSGDLIRVAIAATSSSTTATAPDGTWTQTTTISGSVASEMLFHKTATATDAANAAAATPYTFTLSASSRFSWGSWSKYSDIGGSVTVSGSPVTGTQGTVAAAGSVNAPSITPSANNEELECVVAGGTSTSGATTTFTAPSGMTLILSACSTSGLKNAALGAARLNLGASSSGTATGTKSFTTSSALGNAEGATVLLAESGGGTATPVTVVAVNAVENTSDPAPVVIRSSANVIPAAKSVVNASALAPAVITGSAHPVVVAAVPAVVNESVLAPVVQHATVSLIKAVPSTESIPVRAPLVKRERVSLIVAVATNESTSFKPPTVFTQNASSVTLQPTGIAATGGVGTPRVGATVQSPVVLTVPPLVENTTMPGNGMMITEFATAGGGVMLENTSALAPALHASQQVVIKPSRMTANTSVLAPTVRPSRVVIMKPPPSIVQSRDPAIAYSTSQASSATILATPAEVDTAMLRPTLIHTSGVRITATPSTVTASVRPVAQVIRANRRVLKPPRAVENTSFVSPVPGAVHSILLVSTPATETASARAPKSFAQRRATIHAAPAVANTSVLAPVVGQSRPVTVHAVPFPGHTVMDPAIIITGHPPVHLTHADVRSKFLPPLLVVARVNPGINMVVSTVTSVDLAPSLVYSKGVTVQAPPAIEKSSIAPRIVAGAVQATKIMGPTRTVTMSYVTKEQDF